MLLSKGFKEGATNQSCAKISPQEAHSLAVDKIQTAQFRSDTLLILNLASVF